MSATATKHPHWVVACRSCACLRVQSTAWVDCNRGEVRGHEGPTENYWCPRCCCDDAMVEAIYRSDIDRDLWRDDYTGTLGPLRDVLRMMMQHHKGSSTRGPRA